MVDFNDSTTMSRPPKEVLNMMILQELQDLIEAIELLELKDSKLRDSGLPELKSKLLGLVSLIRTPLKKQLESDKNKSQYKTIPQLRKAITELDYGNKDLIYEIVDYIEEFLYNKDVTKWDTKEPVDRKDVWGNKQKYLGTG